MPKFTEAVCMRDGVQLVTDVYLPGAAANASEGPWPVIIIRTPYRRGGLAAFRTIAADDYALIVQDVRGTGDSGGSFGFLAGEPADALDTAAWLLRQSWCDGRFGIVGISYLAGASIAIAAEMPDRVKACVWVTMPLGRDWLCWRNGALRLHHALPWSLLISGKPLGGHDWASLYGTLPLAAAAPETPFWQTISAGAQSGAAFWQANDLTPYLGRIRAPGLHFAGWYDFLNDASFGPYSRLVRAGRAPQRLIIGPYGHNGMAGDADGCGDIHYGDIARPRFAAEVAAWFAHWFNGRPYERTSGVRAFLTGSGAGWRELPEWGSGDVVPLYLAHGGRLALSRPTAATDSFVSDPCDPVPTQGGAVWEFPGAHMGLEPGPAMQTTATRADVLAYDSAPLTEPLAVCGPAMLTMEAASSGEVSDFTAKICDVAEDGTSRFVCDGIVRSCFEPGRARQLTLDMACGHIFGAGHCLRLEVAGSNFPKYDRGMAAATSLEESAAAHEPVRQTVGIGPSRLALTVHHA